MLQNSVLLTRTNQEERGVLTKHAALLLPGFNFCIHIQLSSNALQPPNILSRLLQSLSMLRDSALAQAITVQFQARLL